MNITEAITHAIDNGHLIRSPFHKTMNYVLKYINDGVFFQYQIVNGKAIYKYEVRDFTTAECIAKWEAIEDTYFK